jgi:hypothetical protein
MKEPKMVKIKYFHLMKYLLSSMISSIIVIVFILIGLSIAQMSKGLNDQITLSQKRIELLKKKGEYLKTLSEEPVPKKLIPPEQKEFIAYSKWLRVNKNFILIQSMENYLKEVPVNLKKDCEKSQVMEDFRLLHTQYLMLRTGSSIKKQAICFDLHLYEKKKRQG